MLSAELETNEGTKRDVFVNGLQGGLKNHLQLHQPITYNEAVRFARVVRDSVVDEKDQYVGDMRKVLETLTEHKTTMDNNKSNYENTWQQQVNKRLESLEVQKNPSVDIVNLANPVDATREVERLMARAN